MTIEVDEVEVIPASQEADDIFSSEDLAALNENRKLRRALIRMLSKGDKLPEDKADKTALIQLMAAADAEILTRARIKVAAKSEEAANNLANAVGSALKNFKIPPRPVITKEAFEVPAHIKAPTPVPGNMDIGNIPLTMADLED